MPRKAGPDTAIDEPDYVGEAGGAQNTELGRDGSVSLEDASTVHPEMEFAADEALVGDFATVGPTVHEQQLQREQLNRETADVIATMRELEGADEIKWRIYRTADPEPSRNGYLATWTGSQISQDRIRDKFGGGKYKFIGYYTNGRYAAHKVIVIADDAPRTEGSKVNSQNGPQFDLSGFLAQQDARDQRRRAEEEERRRYEEEREEKRSRDRLTLIAAVATPAATVLAALLGNRGPDMASLITAMKPPDPLQLLAGLKTLMPEPQPVVPQPDAIDKAITIMEKIDALKGNPNGETNWMDLLREVIKSAGPGAGQAIAVLAQRAAAARAERAGTVQPQVLSAPAQPALPSPENAAPLGAGADVNILKAARLIPWLKAQIEKFLPAARRRGSDPELYAALMLDELPEDQDADALTQFVERPDWFEWLKSIDPRVAESPQWFAQMRAHLLEYLKEGDEPAQPPETAQVPAGRHRGQRVPVVHIDGGAGAMPTENASEESVVAQRPPSLTERGL